MAYKPTLSLDFDGVIHSYKTPFERPDIIPDPPVEGAIKALHEYVEHFQVCIFSTRSGYPGGIEAMKEWLDKWEDNYWAEKEFNGDLPYRYLTEVIHFPTDKPPAFLFIDDRAITFTGQFPVSDVIMKFRPWYDDQPSLPLEEIGQGWHPTKK